MPTQNQVATTENSSYNLSYLLDSVQGAKTFEDLKLALLVRQSWRPPEGEQDPGE